MEFSRVLFRSEHLQRRAEQPTDHVVLVRVAQHLKQGEQGRLELCHRVIPSLRVLGRSRRASRGGPSTCGTDTTCLVPKGHRLLTPPQGTHSQAGALSVVLHADLRTELACQAVERTTLGGAEVRRRDDTKGHVALTIGGESLLEQAD